MANVFSPFRRQDDMNAPGATESKIFDPTQIKVVNQSTAMAEELVSNHYKLSSGQWLRQRYDVKTLADLNPAETVSGPFAQVIRYKGRPKNAVLGSSSYDFYKICLQDNAILEALEKGRNLRLLPFTLYIISHELIHIVRFSHFLQNFEATEAEKQKEEQRVHKKTHEILAPVQVEGLEAVLDYYRNWRTDPEAVDATAG